jgi:hypothetical protein
MRLNEHSLTFPGKAEPGGESMSIKPIIAAIAVAGAGLVTTEADAASYAIDLTAPCTSVCTGTLQAVGVFTLDPADAGNFAAWTYNIQLISSDTGGVVSFTDANSSLNSRDVDVVADATALTLSLSPTAGEGYFEVLTTASVGYLGFYPLSLNPSAFFFQYNPSGTANYARTTLAGPTVSFAAIADVPAPAALPLMAGALAGLGWLGRRRAAAS